MIAQPVRWWDADDGWKMGVLCSGCGEDAAERGPRPDDYAVVTRANPDEAERIDVEAGDDLDAAYSGGL